MNILKPKLTAVALGLLYGSLGFTPAYADDTDIFFGGVSTDVVKPNVLFILDNSGSMGSSLNNSTRLQVMKDSFRNIMQNVSGINAGIMRFNSPGGAVVFPVADLDKELTELAFVTEPLKSASISQSSDDATEDLSTSLANVTIADPTLALGSDLTNLQTATVQVSQNSDDEEERVSDGDMRAFGNVLNMNSEQTNAVRFQDVDIPQNAYVDSATMIVNAYDNYTGDVTLRWFGEANASPDTFSNTNSNISSRTKTTASVDWQPSSWSQWDYYSTPDLSPIVQEIVNLGDWNIDANHRDMAFIQTYVDGLGERGVRSHNNNSSAAASLVINYQDPADGFKGTATGLRFAEVNIPSGVTVTRAYIEFTAAKTSKAGNQLTLEIRAQDDTQPATFSTSVSSDVTLRPTTTDMVAWDTPDWVSGEVYRTPDLTNLVQDIINDNAWCGGNPMAFILKASSTTPNGKRDAWSQDGTNGLQPKLVIEYDENTETPASCVVKTITRTIQEGSDDAEQGCGNNPNTNNNGNDIDFRDCMVNGHRFTNIPLKKNADVLDARLTFTVKNNDVSSTSDLTFKIQDAANAESFQETTDNITSRPTASATVAWNSTTSPALGAWDEDASYTSPDLSTLIEAVTSRSDWTPGNAIALIQSMSSGSVRETYSYEGNSAAAAKLTIKVKKSDLDGSAGITVREHLVNLVDAYQAETYTPIVDTLYEAARYYRGDSVYWADKRYSGGSTDVRDKRLSTTYALKSGDLSRPALCNESNLDSWDCVSEELINNPVYDSPIDEGCQANYIVLLTDGKANQNHSRDLIKDYINVNSCKNGDNDEQCSEELVEWLATTDQSSLPGENTVQTFTIAFDLNDSGAVSYLQGLAQDGGGKFLAAGDELQLTTAFNQIIQDILANDTTFVVPGATVNQFSRLTNRDEVYFSVFKPDTRPTWKGNLKRYKIATSGTNQGELVGQDDVLAVNEDTGFFAEGVHSFWSDTGTDPADGPQVAVGGAAAQLPTHSNRKIYTYYSGGDTSVKNNVFADGNTDVTKALLGIGSESDAYRTSLIQWARGLDVKDEDGDGDTTDDRQHMGDPLHSSPVAITYGGTEANPDMTIYVTTNEGFLHAIDAATGEEQFAFIPGDLLPNLNTFFVNSRTDDHPYGLDGGITRWVYDANNDNQIKASDGDHAYLFIGMRRGGDKYYALDVTDRSDPKLMWMIDGGTAPFDELGQTWSQPILSQVMVDDGSGNDEVKDVLVFGGGYDPDQDTASIRTPDSQGRAIYMVEAGYPDSGLTPDVVWRGGVDSYFDLQLTDMEYSIPAALRVGDLNGDGLADQMYVGDMGGQIWRFDINNGNPRSSLVQGGVIADLAEDNSQANTRRFYNPIDASSINFRGERFIAISVGSGWRANPLDKVVDDRFYMIKQGFGTPSSYTKLTESDLYDATANNIQSSDETTRDQAASDLAAAQGWYIRLTNDGEKVLAGSLTLNAQVIFTTYEPNAQTSSCNAAVGTARAYVVNILDATPTVDFDPSASGLERSVILDTGSIPPSPLHLIPSSGEAVTLVGTEVLKGIDTGLLSIPTFWVEESQ